MVDGHEIVLLEEVLVELPDHGLASTQVFLQELLEVRRRFFSFLMISTTLSTAADGKQLEFALAHCSMARSESLVWPLAIDCRTSTLETFSITVSSLTLTFLICLEISSRSTTLSFFAADWLLAGSTFWVLPAAVGWLLAFFFRGASSLAAS